MKKKNKTLWIIIVFVLAVGAAILGTYLVTTKAKEENPSEQAAIITELKVKIEDLQEEIKSFKSADEENKSIITQLNDRVGVLDRQKTDLEIEVKTKQERIDAITTEKNTLQGQLTFIQSQLETAEDNVDTLTSQVASLQTQIDNLTTERTQLLADVEEKQAQITNLTNEKTAALARISTLETQLATSQTDIDGLNARIKELETQLASYIENYEPADTDTYAVVTFEYKDAFYGAQIIEKGSYAMIKEPTSTDRITFNYWMYNNEEFNLETTPITQNMHLVANISMKYLIEFVAINNTGEEIVLSSCYLPNGANITIPDHLEREGFIFDYWTTDGVNEVQPSVVTKDVRYIAHYSVGLIFADCSWQEINEICQEGNAELYFNIGDTKRITLTNNKVIEVKILGFNHDELSNGNGKATITLGTVIPESVTWGRMNYNNVDTNVGGWAECGFRTTDVPQLLELLPDELNNVIKEVNKSSTIGNKSTDITITSDKVWLFSRVEIDGTTADGYKDEGAQYAYWRQNLSTNIETSYCLLRSADISSSSNFHMYFGTGQIRTLKATSSTGFCFGFCI